MSFGISINFNNDGALEVTQINQNKPPREKGDSLLLFPSDYTVIDIETTGFDPNIDEIIEIGAIKVRNNQVVDKFESLVKPNGYYLGDDDSEDICYIDDFITELTGITNEILEVSPGLSEVLPQFQDFIQNDILVGHNVHFDVNFLYDEILNNLGIKLSNDLVDLLRLSRKIFPELSNHKLITVAEHLSIDTSNYHRSLNDCIITYESLEKARNYSIENNINLGSISRRNKHGKNNHVSLKSITAENEDFDEEHLLFNKFCTFTGKLEKMERKDAAQVVVNFGGKCLNNVTKQTNFLILGNFDYCSNIKGNKTSKLKKAEQLILNGQDLKIISEDVFYDLILGN